MVAPLEVWDGLKVPHEEEGEQDQSTPALVESFVTFAAIVTVWPAVIVEGGAALKAIERVGGGGVVFDDPTAPHPEKTIATSRRAVPAAKPKLKVVRIFFTMSSLLTRLDTGPAPGTRQHRRSEEAPAN